MSTCKATWELPDPRKEGNTFTHICALDANHDGECVCECGKLKLITSAKRELTKSEIIEDYTKLTTKLARFILKKKLGIISVITRMKNDTAGDDFSWSSSAILAEVPYGVVIILINSEGSRVAKYIEDITSPFPNFNFKDLIGGRTYAKQHTDFDHLSEGFDLLVERISFIYSLTKAAEPLLETDELDYIL